MRRLPPQLRVSLGPSRLAAVFVVVMAVATGGIVLLLPVPAWAAAAALALLAGWAWRQLRAVAWRSLASSVCEVALTLDRTVVVRRRDGTLVAGVVRDASYVTPSVTTLVWKPDGAWRAHALLVLPDMLPAEDFRRLRVALRYGRREDEAGAPASHA